MPKKMVFGQVLDIFRHQLLIFIEIPLESLNFMHLPLQNSRIRILFAPVYLLYFQTHMLRTQCGHPSSTTNSNFNSRHDPLNNSTWVENNKRQLSTKLEIWMFKQKGNKMETKLNHKNAFTFS